MQERALPRYKTGDGTGEHGYISYAVEPPVLALSISPTMPKSIFQRGEEVGRRDDETGLWIGPYIFDQYVSKLIDSRGEWYLHPTKKVLVKPTGGWLERLFKSWPMVHENKCKIWHEIDISGRFKAYHEVPLADEAQRAYGSEIVQVSTIQ